MALPIACVAPHARDVRAPLCLSPGATSRFGVFIWDDDRGVGDRALDILAGMTAGAGSTLGARWKAPWRAGGWAKRFAQSRITCAARVFPAKNIPRLPWSPFGRTIIFFNDFYSVEKRVTRSREWR